MILFRLQMSSSVNDLFGLCYLPTPSPSEGLFDPMEEPLAWCSFSSLAWRWSELAQMARRVKPGKKLSRDVFFNLLFSFFFLFFFNFCWRVLFSGVASGYLFENFWVFPERRAREIGKFQNHIFLHMLLFQKFSYFIEDYVVHWKETHAPSRDDNLLRIWWWIR